MWLAFSLSSAWQGGGCRWPELSPQCGGHGADFDLYVKVSHHEIWDQSILDKYYTITELTREFGISTRTLRFYEDEGLIHPERRGRTRLFRSTDRRLIQEILRGRRIGFTIAEIREIIQVYKDPPGEAGQLRLLMRKVEEKREDLRQKRRDIEETLVELDHIEESCLTRLAEIGVNT